jgi:hypothetical protein
MYITKYGQNYIFAPFEGLRKHSCSATPSAHVATITDVEAVKYQAYWENANFYERKWLGRFIEHL